MKRLRLRLLLFVSPFLGLWALELLLPLDAFTFRAWEALSAHGFPSAWTGPFYPERALRRREVGDLGHHTPFAEVKDVVWRTDRYGFRTDGAVERFDIVLLGDSNTAGSGLSQEDTLAHVLARELDRGVYPYAPARVSSLLAERRFQKVPPNAVVVVAAERALPLLNFETAPPAPFWHSWHKALLADGPAARSLLVVLARARQRLLLQALKAKAQRLLARGAEVLLGVPPRRGFAVGADGKTLFIEETGLREEELLADIPLRVDMLKTLQGKLAARGTWMLLVPTPNKATVYPDLLPGRPRSRYRTEFTLAAKAAGLDVVDVRALFKAHRRRGGAPLYLADDTHWNARGVQITATGVAAALRRL